MTLRAYAQNAHQMFHTTIGDASFCFCLPEAATFAVNRVDLALSRRGTPIHSVTIGARSDSRYLVTGTSTGQFF